MALAAAGRTTALLRARLGAAAGALVAALVLAVGHLSADAGRGFLERQRNLVTQVLAGRILALAATAATEHVAEATTAMHVSSLYGLALILFVITFIVLSAAKLMLMGMSRKEGVK